MPKTKRVIAHVEPEIHERLKKFSQESGIRISEFLRRAIESGLRHAEDTHGLPREIDYWRVKDFAPYSDVETRHSQPVLLRQETR